MHHKLKFLHGCVQFAIVKTINRQCLSGECHDWLFVNDSSFSARNLKTFWGEGWRGASANVHFDIEEVLSMWLFSRRTCDAGRSLARIFWYKLLYSIFNAKVSTVLSSCFFFTPRTAWLIGRSWTLINLLWDMKTFNPLQKYWHFKCETIASGPKSRRSYNFKYLNNTFIRVNINQDKRVTGLRERRMYNL